MLMYKHVNICELVLKGSGTEAFELLERYSTVVLLTYISK